MMYKRFTLGLLLAGSVLGVVRTGEAHVTPPVVLVSERDAVIGMTSGASKFFVRDVRLTAADRAFMQKQWGWRPAAEQYRFYLGRAAEGELVTAVIFLTDYTLHGPVRVAVGMGADGRVKDAQVVELTEETFPWLQPLLEAHFTRAYIGQDSRTDFHRLVQVEQRGLQSMSQFYGELVSSLIQRAVVLFDVAVLRRDEKS